MSRSLLTVLLAVLMPMSVAVAQPGLDFDKAPVRLVGVTPGGSVVWFLAAHDRPRVVIREIGLLSVTKDEDLDGVVTFDRFSSVPEFSVWFAIDLDSGEYALSTSPAWETVPPNSPRGPFVSGALRPTEAIQTTGEAASVLVVRPRSGAWFLKVLDGSGLDRDRSKDGSITLQVRDFQAVAGSFPPPSALQPGDVVFAVNVQTLEFGVVVVGEK